MKILRLWIEQFKNLRDFDIQFDQALTTVVIGGNGTGKSNLLEALAIIFRDLDLELKNQDALSFEYYLVYECRNNVIEIDANPSRTYSEKTMQMSLFELGEVEKERRRGRLLIKINDKDIPMSRFFDNKHEYLPNHVFGYYSGPTNRLARHFEQHQKQFYDQQRRGEERPLRPLFFALPVHSQFVLLAYFSFPDEEAFTFLREYLGITRLESVLFVVKEPDWWDRKAHPDDVFWGATGIPRGFLQSLYDAALAPIRDTEKVLIRTGKSTDEQRLYLYIQDQEMLRNVAEQRKNNKEFFKDLDTLYISRLLSEVRIRVRKLGIEGDITFSELSEGEQQLLTVLGLLKFTRDTESLFLLDEPDTHLNPAWKQEYMRLIEPIVGENSQCQILLITHDPIVMGSCLKEQVRVLSFEGEDKSGKKIWFEPDRDPRGMGVSALLTSEVYGLRSSLDWETQDKLDLKRKLAAKEPEELTDDEKLTLQRLNGELKDLDFTYSVRDNLYPLFVKAMTEELEQHPELQQSVLTKDQQELQLQLARNVVANLRRQYNPE
jgi:predicted ATP-binding protein involved in virulence